MPQSTVNEERVPPFTLPRPRCSLPAFARFSCAGFASALTLSQRLGAFFAHGRALFGERPHLRWGPATVARAVDVCDRAEKGGLGYRRPWLPSSVRGIWMEQYPDRGYTPYVTAM